ncbi:MAG: hypothetical protein WDO06_07785 [Actinomycetota bacterium]
MIVQTYVERKLRSVILTVGMLASTLMISPSFGASSTQSYSGANDDVCDDNFRENSVNC